MNTKNTRRLMLIAVPVLGLAAYGIWSSAGPRATAETARKVMFYQDSMHPWIKSTHTGKCTICNMDLTPIFEGDKGFAASPDVVVLNSNAITVLNVQTEALQRRALSRTLQVAGTLEANDGRKAVLAAPARGRIEYMAVEYAGVEVAKGETLINFYSPDLTALRRILIVGNPVNQGSNATVTSPDRYLGGLVAPISGVVLERNVYSGQWVAEGDRLLTIADASLLWFRFDVYESQLPWLKLGQKIQVTVAAVPGKVFPATISFIEPTLNDATRTVKIRADIENPADPGSKPLRRLLGFGMYADGRVRAEIPGVLTVPRTAILFPGNSAYAYVDNGDGAYERRRVKLGRQGDTVWEVVAGLAEGERVVSSGNVLLDAQAQFAQGNTEAAEAPGEPEPAADDPKPTMLSSTDTAGADGDCATASPAVMAMPDQTDPISRMGKMVSARAEMALPRQVGTTEEHSIAVPVISQPQPPAVTNSSPPPSLADIVVQAAGVSGALAADDLAQFNQQVARISALIAAVQNQPGAVRADSRNDDGSGGGVLFLPRHGVRAEEELCKRLAVISKGEPAKDLTDARARFLPFSTMIVGLAQQLKQQDPAFSALKVYHCPMAPKPGLWLQSKGPLANPFFGSAMLTCGKEVQ